MMDHKRRFFLKGALASGAGSVLLGGSGLAQAALNLGATGAEAVPTLVLAANAAVEASFAAGARAALANGAQLELLRSDREANPLALLQQAAERGERLRLIGLVDDASGELLVAQARRAGLRMSWLGQHSAEAGVSRHQVISAGAGQSAVLTLGEQLKQEAAGFALQAQQPFAAARDLELTAASQGAVSARWAAYLGHALVAPQAPVDAAALSAHSERLEGRFVSFVIEV